MKFTKALIKGKFMKRYKRFFVDVKVNKAIITAHCPNTGSMMGLLEKNNEVKSLLNVREINELFDLNYFLKNINAIYKKVLG